MSDLDYPACISELYQGEVLGEQLFLALLAAARNERESYHFGTLLQLESETKTRLRPFLHKHRLDFVEPQNMSEQVDGFVALYQGNSWLDFLSALKPVVDQFLGRFKEIALMGPEEDQEVLQSMVTHEEAFSHWIEKEVAGEEGALNAAIVQLQYPLTAPL